MEQNQGTRYGKMSQGHSPQTMEKTLKKYLKKSLKSKDIKLMRLDLTGGKMQDLSWQIISASHGGYLMLTPGIMQRTPMQRQGIKWCFLKVANPLMLLLVFILNKP